MFRTNAQFSTTTYQAIYVGKGEFYTGLRPGDIVTVERDVYHATGDAHLSVHRVIDGVRQASLSLHNEADVRPL